MGEEGKYRREAGRKNQGRRGKGEMFIRGGKKTEKREEGIREKGNLLLRSEEAEPRSKF